MKIISIIGARPQFIKHAPIEKALSDHFESITIHTGQHYDENMSTIFFNQLAITSPKYLLQIGSGNHGAQTGKMMEVIEPILLDEKPNAVLVYGDTNSTLAGALVASKLHIPVIHLEAGLRSFNKEMPEEINRVLTDHISEILFAPSDKAVKNLKNEGIEKNVFKTGDVMCDMIHLSKKSISEPKDEDPFYYATIHRPYNTDDRSRLLDVLNSFQSLKYKVQFAIHPRTQNKMKEWEIERADFNNIEFLDPVSYFDNISLLSHSEALITDSGGMQKEAYILQKKCVTIRTETEWVETLVGNWNTLVFDELDKIQELLNLEPNLHNDKLYGDGKASEQIVEIILDCLK